MSTNSSSLRLDEAARLAHVQPTRLLRILDEAEEEYRRTGGLSHEEFWRAVDDTYRHELSDAEDGAGSREALSQ